MKQRAFALLKAQVLKTTGNITQILLDSSIHTTYTEIVNRNVRFNSANASSEDRKNDTKKLVQDIEKTGSIGNTARQIP